MLIEIISTIGVLITPLLIARSTGMQLVALTPPTFWVDRVTHIKEDWHLLDIKMTVADYPFHIRKVKSDAQIIAEVNGWDYQSKPHKPLVPLTGKSSLTVDWSFDRDRGLPRMDNCDGKLSLLLKSHKSRIVISMRIHTSTIFLTRKAKLTVITNKENE